MRIKHAITIVLIFLIFLLLIGCKKQAEEQKPIAVQEKKTEEKGLVMITLAKINFTSEIELNINKAIVVTNKASDELEIGKKEIALKTIRREDLLASGNIRAGKIKEINLEIEITKPESIMPGRNIKIETDLSINPDKITIIRLELVPEQSFFETIDGKTIFAPVFRIEIIENGELIAFADRSVKLTRGSETNQTMKIGMNEKGKTGVEFRIPKEAKLTFTEGQLEIMVPKINNQTREDVIGGYEIILQNTNSKLEKLHARKGEKIKIKIKSLDATYGVKIKDTITVVNPEKEEEIIVLFDEKGLYDITCEQPCFNKDGKVLAKIVVT